MDSFLDRQSRRGNLKFGQKAKIGADADPSLTADGERTHSLAADLSFSPPEPDSLA